MKLAEIFWPMGVFPLIFRICQWIHYSRQMFFFCFVLDAHRFRVFISSISQVSDTIHWDQVTWKLCCNVVFSRSSDLNRTFKLIFWDDVVLISSKEWAFKKKNSDLITLIIFNLNWLSDFNRLKNNYFCLSLFYLGSDVENLLIPITDYVHYYIEFSCVDLPEEKSDCECFIFV